MARFYDNEGHGLRRKHIGEVHAWLAERCQAFQPERLYVR
jgi:hypothetical protein